MANIYELTAQYKHLQTALECEPDDEEIAVLLAEVEDDIEAKADGYAKIIRNLETEVSGLDGEIKRLTDRKNSRKNSIARLKENLMHSMKETGKVKFKTELFSFGVQKNGGLAPLIVKVEPSELPAELQKVTIEADNTKIRDYINETGDVTFADFGERGERLSIR